MLLGWTVLLVYLFFGKKKRFPRSAIAFMVISVQIAAIAQGPVGAAIWIPYLMKSKRVRVTVVE